ncbi:flavin-nucleotide-binding protein [Terasakiispira papahanaumokuakeensis]|uniref:Flavin-nucleotide-binding protein n=1 Tax=Terasakiispira papahanaumokuakeensis TaxID=197479 RepID=A0A1E2V5F9_9GAMM|nr:pyridoxamine 5'-phosphate oxidase family protein [Terasakiispira papahanaumokuakeensis]ODC02229.1 flavin-nucleotide-binding protein [Terasakiispira papahanaumokuakeensis]
MQRPSNPPSAPTQKTQVKRGAKKAHYDQATLYAILDEAFVCHVAAQQADHTGLQPTLHWREGDRLYIHGSSKNGLFRALIEGAEACIGVTLLDGIVFARSAFHHSVNYRSVIIYGYAKPIIEPQEKRRLLDLMLEKFSTGRSQEARPPNENELKATDVLAFELTEMSGKLRTGGPVDDAADMALPIWAGVKPLTRQWGEIDYDHAPIDHTSPSQ